MKPNIIATLGNQFDYSDMKIIDELLENNVDYFRFNLSKYDDISALESRVKMISNIQRNYHNKIKIMLDLPFPGRKPRLYISEKQRDVSKGEQIIFSSDKSLRMTGDIVFVDVEKFGKKIEECSDIVYADGEGSFKVLEKYVNNTAKVVANNSFIMYNTKSLSFNFFVTNNNFNKDYCDVISQIQTESIAFSFVTHAEEVLRIKECLNTKSIISKIESQKGVANVDNIASVSNIMLGRGDLCLNANMYKLVEYQRKVANACKNNHSEFYFATGILSSLVKQPRPSQADIVDVTNILMLKPEYIIFNYALILHNCITAIETVNRIYEYNKDTISTAFYNFL